MKTKRSLGRQQLHNCGHSMTVEGDSECRGSPQKPPTKPPEKIRFPLSGSDPGAFSRAVHGRLCVQFMPRAARESLLPAEAVPKPPFRIAGRQFNRGRIKRQRQALEEQIDTSSAAGEPVFHIFGAIAHVERRLISGRTCEELASAQLRLDMDAMRRKPAQDRLAQARGRLRSKPCRHVRRTCNSHRLRRQATTRCYGAERKDREDCGAGLESHQISQGCRSRAANERMPHFNRLRPARVLLVALPIRDERRAAGRLDLAPDRA